MECSSPGMHQPRLCIPGDGLHIPGNAPAKALHPWGWTAHPRECISQGFASPGWIAHLRECTSQGSASPGIDCSSPGMQQPRLCIPGDGLHIPGNAPTRALHPAPGMDCSSPGMQQPGLFIPGDGLHIPGHAPAKALHPRGWTAHPRGCSSQGFASPGMDCTSLGMQQPWLCSPGE